ncbi:helix-turn-helix domain protein [mine drainage metagenome]|uniref:Helix-turn-helix domain protein n=1 Tax=mine drainage metagenome TaxID=410659 RepID=A0A1J5R0X7_9ZZZZ
MSSTVTGPSRLEFLTVAQAAEELHVTERFIRKLIAAGDLRAVKVGARVVRIRRTDLDDLLRPARVVPRLGRR